MNSVTFKNVNKIYYPQNSNTLLTSLLARKKTKNHVLRSISFSVKKGEVLGVIGRNGSGKSTILKLISGILSPTSGNITTHGKIASLIELGGGFHHDLTGIENIELNALLMGFTKNELKKKLDTIISFSDIGDALYNPLRTYSSGMVIRLAFSIAVNLDPDILIIDEVLAVGDEAFQKKSLRKMTEFKRKGKTIIVVSHNLVHIEDMCDKVLVLSNGKIVYKGNAKKALLRYKKENIFSHIKSDTTTSSTIKITNTVLRSKSTLTESRIVLTLSYIVLKKISSLNFGFGIYTNDGTYCTGVNTCKDKIYIKPLSGKVTITFDTTVLLPGMYYINIVAFEKKESFPYLFINHAQTFSKKQKASSRGIVDLKRNWEQTL